MIVSQRVRRYLLTSTVMVLGAAVWSGSTAAQAQTQALTATQAQPNHRGGGGGGSSGGGGSGGGSSGGGSSTTRATDPGVRGGPAGAGGPLTGLSQDELNFFTSSTD